MVIRKNYFLDKIKYNIIVDRQSYAGKNIISESNLLYYELWLV